MKVFVTGAIGAIGADSINEFDAARLKLNNAGHKVSDVLQIESNADARALGPKHVKLLRFDELIHCDVVCALDNYEMDEKCKTEIAMARYFEIPVETILTKLLHDTTTTTEVH
jgi:Domain of unknown function (DUF4406)